MRKIICPICKKEFVNNYKHRKYCSQKCYDEFYNDYNKMYFQNHKDYYQIHKEQRLKNQKKYYIKNRKKILEHHKKYCQTHRKERALCMHKYIQNNFNRKMRQNLRKRIWDALKNNYKSESTIKLIGCSIEFLKKYLESKFKLGMNWDNYGKWHIDHIRPCSSFDLSKEEEQYKCFNYINLQPLWAEENLQKHNKIHKGE